MGYCSDFEIKTKGKSLPEDFDKVFFETTDYDIDELYDIKWYDMNTNMLHLSAIYPETKFIVTQEAEDNKFSKHYFYNGQSESVEGIVVYKDTTLWTDDEKL